MASVRGPRPKNPGELTRENTAATFPDNVPSQTAKFWVENLAPESFVRLQSGEAIGRQRSGAGRGARPSKLDQQGWPVSAQWAGMKKPLFASGLGDFSAVKVDGLAPRWVLKDICAAGSSPRGDELRKQAHRNLCRPAPEGKATVEQTPHTRVYVQHLEHPRLRWAQRRLELWNREPRARLTLRLNRLSSEAPEILYASFTLPCEGIASAIELRRQTIYAVRRPDSRHLPRLLRHRRLGRLCHAGRPLAVGEPGRPARDARQPASLDALPDAAEASGTSAVDALQQLLVYELRRRRTWRHGVSVRSRLAREARLSSATRRRWPSHSLPIRWF